jgi:Protein of unknown function (DUF3551)
MRRVPLILAGLLASVCIYSATAPAHAEGYPVCLEGGSANTVECNYTTLAQCQATAAGGLGYCVASPGDALNAYASYGRGSSRRMH